MFKMTEEKLKKERMMEYQFLEQQIQNLNNNLNSIEQNLIEIKSMIKTLVEFKSLKKGDKIKASLSNGIFAEAVLRNTKNLQVNVGGQVVVSKTVDETKEMLETQLEELEKYRKQTMSYYNEIYARLEQIQKNSTQ
ncbi:prefoldin subunit alpha [Candidatus Woesearchaeota archaeon]|jgi:prefoldin alpha subunit|nr:prefoldin subunit alpha [Candidatus Woesearchaeota archaeon]|tara:strand:+ start:318 stop:725 length:408 start_codon:yes stop_codon:yes gene_type:complete